MSAIPYMPFYVADYLADAAHLTTLEHGAYMLLIMNYWQRGKALINTNERLTNVARLSNDEWAKVKPKLMEFFVIEGDEWVHPRIEELLSFVRNKSVKASNAGKASAQRKLNRRSTDVQQTFNETGTDVEQTPNHTNTNTNIDLYKDAHEELKIEVATIEDMYDPDFNDWYDNTWPADDPLRRKKPQAAVAYRHAKEKTTPLALKTSLQSQVNAELLMKKHNYKFIVSRGTPVNWLDGEGWLIYVPTEAEIIAGKPPLSAEERKKQDEIEAQQQKEIAKKRQEESDKKLKKQNEFYENMEDDCKGLYYKHWTAHYAAHLGSAPREVRAYWDWVKGCTIIDKKLGVPDYFSIESEIRRRVRRDILDIGEVLETIDWDTISLDGL